MQHWIDHLTSEGHPAPACTAQTSAAPECPMARDPFTGTQIRIGVMGSAATEFESRVAQLAGSLVAQSQSRDAVCLPGHAQGCLTKLCSVQRKPAVM